MIIYEFWHSSEATSSDKSKIHCFVREIYEKYIFIKLANERPVTALKAYQQNSLAKHFLLASFMNFYNSICQLAFAGAVTEKMIYLHVCIVVVISSMGKPSPSRHLVAFGTQKKH